MGWMVNATPRSLYPRERPGTHCIQEAEWDQGPVWTGAENLIPQGFDPRIAQPVSSRHTN
jgi:hypothetical protein